MPTEVILPKVDMDMTQARIVDWHVAEGGVVAQGDPLFDMETDKSVMEVEAPAKGTLARITGNAGDDIPIGTTVAWILAAGEGADALPDSEADTESAPAASTGAPIDEAGATRQIRATPLARRLAREQGIELASLTGSGPAGRIGSADVRKAGGSAAARPELNHAHDIAYVMAGPPDGHPHLLLHGFAADHSAFSVLTHALARAGHRVLVPDLPAHGQTRREASHPEALTIGLQQLATEHRMTDGVHLIAHSLGTVPALALAASIKPATLTLIAPVGMGLTLNGTFIRGIAAPGSVGELSHLLRELSARRDVLSPGALSALFERLGKGRLTALAEQLIGQSGQALNTVEALEQLAQHLPVRVIVGMQDRIIDWHDACHLSSRIAIHHLPQAGHMPHWDAPNEVLDILLDRLR